MKPQGKALGRIVLSKLEAAGVYVTGYRWVYRPHIVRPTGPFPAHRALAGEYVESIPTVDGWEPGDHTGCSCDSQPVMRSPDGRFLPQAALGTVHKRSK